MVGGGGEWKEREGVYVCAGWLTRRERACVANGKYDIGNDVC